MDYLYTVLVPTAEGFNEQLLCIIQMQLAVVVDISKKLIECTYLLEGDGPLAFVVYSILNRVRLDFDTRFATMDYPNVNRLSQDFATRGIVIPPPFNVSGDAAAWKEYGKIFAQPCRDFFFDSVWGHASTKMYFAVQVTNPDFFHRDVTWKTEASLAESIRKILQSLVVDYRFITIQTVDDLVSELSLYLEVCQREGIDFSNVVKVTQCLPFITEFWDKYKN